ncbi:hypothetical protein cyc_06869 [Cyclospora cayetanensis]|uniref:Uncharacterized protein n=1 Tax=Cyclospora cayetanensis TaxID=88456 RepID=A0A1D3D7C2_9EIME|nr:hypothetical protein cyc_06869 [Cyclospora cayetanensis]
MRDTYVQLVGGSALPSATVAVCTGIASSTLRYPPEPIKHAPVSTALTLYADQETGNLTAAEALWLLGNGYMQTHYVSPLLDIFLFGRE